MKETPKPGRLSLPKRQSIPELGGSVDLVLTSIPLKNPTSNISTTVRGRWSCVRFPHLGGFDWWMVLSLFNDPGKGVPSLQDVLDAVLEGESEDPTLIDPPHPHDLGETKVSLYWRTNRDDDQGGHALRQLRAAVRKNIVESLLTLVGSDAEWAMRALLPRAVPCAIRDFENGFLQVWVRLDHAS